MVFAQAWMYATRSVYGPQTGETAEPAAAKPCAVTAGGDGEHFSLHSKLVQESRRFRAAVSERRGMLTAVDRFYLDILVCQWRVTALDAMVAAVRAAVGDAPLPQTAAVDSVSAADEQEWRSDALERCAMEVDAQQGAALEALQHRADAFRTGLLARSTGALDRLAEGESEKQRAKQRLFQLVIDTFSDIIAECRELLQVAPSTDALRACQPTLDRRRTFWDGQLAETSCAWEVAAAALDRSGDDAVAAWTEFAATVKHGQLREDLVARPGMQELLRALSEAAGQCMEVELIDSLGLAGLEGLALAAVDARKDEMPEAVLHAGADNGGGDVWQTMRFTLLQTVLRQLEKAGALCDVELRSSADLLSSEPGAPFRLI